MLVWDWGLTLVSDAFEKPGMLEEMFVYIAHLFLKGNCQELHLGGFVSVTKSTYTLPLSN